MSHLLLRFLTVVIVATNAPLLASEPPESVPAGIASQYIFLNIAPQYPWNQSQPETFTPEPLREIVDAVGSTGHAQLRVGASFIFNILEDDPKVLADSLGRLLKASSTADVPILITLDGQNWWQKRPDLWNWWDPQLPGFNPVNRENVEWTSWEPESAVKIGWRNWGRQIRVRPAPNLSSKRFLDEHWKAYDVLIPIIRRWYADLPESRKYLFGGVKVGWEASINVNAYYYPGGNALYEQSPNDASNDPHDRDMAQGWTFGHAPLGYAAVRTAGIKSSGPLLKEDIERVVHDYLEKLARHVHERGIPASMIFTHQGGTYPPWEKHLSFSPAINEHSIPGWSFYTHDPADCGGLAQALDHARRTQWAASEWWRGAGDVKGWTERFERTLSFKECRLICVYNWDKFMNASGGVEALKSVIER